MASLASLKVLIVDDHAAFRATIRHLFEGDSQITEAASGEEAIQSFAQHHQDWIIMDVRMPGMGGIKATATLRQMDPHARIILISQFTDLEYSIQAHEAGAFAFVNKENITQLTDIISGGASSKT